MEFMLLFLKQKGAPDGGPECFNAMHELAGELADREMLRRGAPLADESSAVRVRLCDGKPFVTDGPFAESKEVLGGFWIIEVADRAEAIDVACRTPHAKFGTVEVHSVRWRDAAADPGKGTPFLFAFLVEPGLSDPDGSKIQEMVSFGESLKREQRFVETAPLVLGESAARIATRQNKLVITDGPFAETKEAVGGYSLVRVADSGAAVDLAKRYPHAKWGTVEVREILFFDRT